MNIGIVALAVSGIGFAAVLFDLITTWRRASTRPANEAPAADAIAPQVEALRKCGWEVHLTSDGTAFTAEQHAA